MVLRNHWLGTSTSGTRPSNQAITGPTLVVPAGGRLVRFLLFVLVDGFSTSTLGVGTLSSTQWYAQVTVDSNEYGVGRILWTAYEMIPNQAVALYDNQNIPPQRVYSMYHAGGSKLLGCNQKCSYGGPGKGAMTIKSGASTTLPNTAAQWTVNYTLLLKVNYYL
jgi:hypothetical protein